MKKGLLLLSFLILLPFYLLFNSLVYAQDPHFELSPSSGTIDSSGTSIEIVVDTGGEAAKSAKAVIDFDSSLLEVASVQAGDFFDDVSHNIYNSSGQVVINANLSLDSMLESKTGVGTLATMTVNAKTSSGTATMTFDCTEGSSTDSNINDPVPLDIIVCSANINGSYNLSTTSSTDSSDTDSTGSATSHDEPGIGGDSVTQTTIPVTGTQSVTIALLIGGLFLILTSAFLKLSSLRA